MKKTQAKKRKVNSKKVYCTWGEHYVDPKDIVFSDDIIDLCKKCDDSLKKSFEKPKPIDPKS